MQPASSAYPQSTTWVRSWHFVQREDINAELRRFWIMKIAHDHECKTRLESSSKVKFRSPGKARAIANISIVHHPLSVPAERWRRRSAAGRGKIKLAIDIGFYWRVGLSIAPSSGYRQFAALALCVLRGVGDAKLLIHCNYKHCSGPYFHARYVKWEFWPTAGFNKLEIAHSVVRGTVCAMGVFTLITVKSHFF